MTGHQQAARMRADAAADARDPAFKMPRFQNVPPPPPVLWCGPPDLEGMHMPIHSCCRSLLPAQAYCWGRQFTYFHSFLL